MIDFVRLKKINYFFYNFFRGNIQSNCIDKEGIDKLKVVLQNLSQIDKIYKFSYIVKVGCEKRGMDNDPVPFLLSLILNDRF